MNDQDPQSGNVANQTQTQLAAEIVNAHKRSLGSASPADSTGDSNTNTENDGSGAKKRRTSTTFLSEEEKKARHIASEKKRRETIRQAFDRIVSLVPDLTPAESRTEVAVLTKSSKFIDTLRQENERLVQLLRLQNVDIPEYLLTAFAETRDPNDKKSD